MAAVTHFSKVHAGTLTYNYDVATEITEYTISWSNLTTAGFANGDEVLILVANKPCLSSQAGSVIFDVGIGSTFAGRSVDSTSAYRVENPASTTNSLQYLWTRKKTLATNDNIYFSGTRSSAANARFKEFVCLILKLSDLGSTNYGYAETTPSGDAPASYDTSGASFTTGAAGDWLLFCTTHWQIDDINDDLYVAISAGGADYSEISSEGESLSDYYTTGTIAYRASLGSGATVRARFKSDGTPHDCEYTSVFGLRLNAFEDHWGAHTTNTVTHSVLDTYSEFAGNGSYGLTTTGPFIVLGMPIHTTNEGTKIPYGRIQIANSDWPAASANRVGVQDNGAAQKIGPFLYGYAASQSSGTLDIDLDVAEDADITPNYSCDQQIAAAFSLTLAASGATVVVPPASLALAGAVPVIKAGAKVTVPAAGLALSGAVPAIRTGAHLTIPASSEFVLSAAVPVIKTGASAAVPAGVLSLSSAVPVIRTGAAPAVPAGVLALAGVIPSIRTGAVVTVPAAIL